MEVSSVSLLKVTMDESAAGLMGVHCFGSNTPHGSMYHETFKNHPEMRIQFLPVGQGDAILFIQWKDGVVWLVDGGPFTFDLVPYLKRRGLAD